MSDPPAQPARHPEAAGPPPCYRHPDKPASVRCAHCDQPICTDCMVAAPVGWQCPDCTRQGARRSRQVPAFTRTSPGRTGVVGSTNPTPIVLTIIAINVVVFFLEDFGNNFRVIDRYSMNPDLVHQQSQYYRAFTAMWLHANFLHILFNMVALLIVGPAVEVLLGKLRFVALYLIAGLGGSVGSYILGPHNEYGIGASGAIMGVLAAYVVIGLRRHLPIAPVVGLIVVNLLIGFSGDIDWRAHLGGLATGAVLAWLYDYAGSLRGRGPEVAVTVGGSVAVLAVLGLLIGGVAPGHFNWS
ncbi:MAG TPA: rhomboid family intramembrane serine protease [Acidimicrobiales bacterium]|nr:rhomboid family intramembrane serine protease [Acidimicrobiales bacterium]